MYKSIYMFLGLEKVLCCLFGIFEISKIYLNFTKFDLKHDFLKVLFWIPVIFKSPAIKDDLKV